MAKEQGFEKIRAQIADLVEQRQAIATAPPPRETLLENLETGIAARAAKFRPMPKALVSGELHVKPTGGPGESELSSLDVACFYAPDRVRELWTAELDAWLADDPPGLPAEKRRSELQRIDQQLYSLAVAEETAIDATEGATGDMIARRGDLSIAAFVEAHGGDRAARAKFQLLEARSAELRAGLGELSKHLHDARQQRARGRAALDDHRHRAGRLREPRQLEEPIAGETRLKSADPKREEKLLRQIDALESEIAGLDERYAAGSERLNTFNAPLQRLRETLARPAAA